MNISSRLFHTLVHRTNNDLKIFDISLKWLTVNFGGLMIETSVYLGKVDNEDSTDCETVMPVRNHFV